MRIRASLLAVAVVVAVTSGTIAPADAAGRVKITKVYFDSPGSDNGSNASVNAEYVTIKNSKSRTKSLSGWTLRDRGGIHVFHFPTFKLAPGAKVRVHTGKGTNTATNLYWNAGGYVWNNSGDKATLRNASGTGVDVCTFTGAGSSVAC